ncbi:MAG: hypothetical protein ACJAVI_003151 [Candidatus Azotimanducaceae bacterium]|jgi:hypothetical protein
MIFKGKWWAHEDSNLGQTDYEAVELRLKVSSKSKNANEFNFGVFTEPTETEPIPNLIGVDWFAELGKWKILNGFR